MLQPDGHATTASPPATPTTPGAGGEQLGRLLQGLDTRQIGRFVEAELGVLAAYDREHGTNLQRVLELALDHDDRNTAARAAYMHRNTFRRQLRKAEELLDTDMASPDARLGLHLALKLRRRGDLPPLHRRCTVHRPA